MSAVSKMKHRRSSILGITKTKASLFLIIVKKCNGTVSSVLSTVFLPQLRLGGVTAKQNMEENHAWKRRF